MVNCTIRDWLTGNVDYMIKLGSLPYHQIGILKSYIQKECCRAHDLYVSNLFSSTKSNNNKRFWSYIKSKRNKQCGVPTLECSNQLFTENVTKANILNDHFSSVFVVDDFQSDETPCLEGEPYPCMQSIYITAQGIAQLLQELDHTKAFGPDGIPTKLLKETSFAISPVLTLIFNASLEQGKLPSDWKKAFITPVYKKGLRTDPSNYRPISITCICGKYLNMSFLLPSLIILINIT